jgi:hypothetical protein
MILFHISLVLSTFFSFYRQYGFLDLIISANFFVGKLLKMIFGAEMLLKRTVLTSTAPSFYSYLSERTGLASAALKVWTLTVKNEMTRVDAAARKNVSRPMPVR